MSFIDHIEELRWHIIRSLLAVAVFAILAFINIDWIFHHVILGPARPDFISYRILCKLGEWVSVPALCLQELQIEFQNTQLAGQLMMSFSVAFTMGFIFAFPYIFWEFWRFIRPALKPEELVYARGIVFWSSLLFFLGVAFAYFLIAPFTINFFAGYQLSPIFKNIITISNYYGTLSELVLGLGIVFELPIIIYFLSRIGLLTPTILRSKRNYAILIIFILAAVITPPDWFSIFLVAIPLMILYELGIVISERAIRQRNIKALKK